MAQEGSKKVNEVQEGSGRYNKEVQIKRFKKVQKDS